jgi:hypothetical protein
VSAVEVGHCGDRALGIPYQRHGAARQPACKRERKAAERQTAGSGGRKSDRSILDKAADSATTKIQLMNIGLASKLRVATAFGALLLGAAACTSQGPVQPSGFEQKIESATTRVDHEEIAQRYERQAGLDRAAAKRHQGYSAIYRKNVSPRAGAEEHLAMARHCDKLAQTYLQAAEENLSMAKLHREMAASMK